ncbi:MAG TPA: hypothetical protein VFL86_21865, partial [Burkholderiaceae bacterium]|nr:hypothetical protein [Burkholderiaceae bacterium]
MNRVATRRPGRAEAAARGTASPRRRGSDPATAEAAAGDAATLDARPQAGATEGAEAWPRYLGAAGPGDVMLMPEVSEPPAHAPLVGPPAPVGGPPGPVEAPATAGSSPVQAAIAPGLLPPDSVDADPAARRARETPLPAAVEVPALRLMERDQASLQGDVQQATHAIDPTAAELTADRHADGASPAPPALEDADAPAEGTRAAGPAAAPGDPEGAPAPDAAAPQAQAGGGSGGPRASAGGGLVLALDAEEVPLDEPLEAALAAMDSTELDVPHEIDVPTLAAQWGAPAELGDDVLPRPDKAGRRGQAPPKPGADKDDKKGGGQGDTQPAGKAKADSPRPSDREQDAEALASARSRAQRAWADLSSAARSRQQGFVDESNRVAAYLGHAYANIADRIESAHEQGIDQLTLCADQACEEIGRVSSSAEMALDQSATDTLVAIQAAAGSAWGAISANEASAGTQIDSIVGGLVAGHQGAFNGVIDKTRKAIDDAVKALTDWSAERTTNYSLNESSKLEGAKNEKRQQRIPRLVEDETKSLNERKTSKIDNWSQTRDTTVCGLSCGYRAPLEAHRTAMHTTGRQSVGKALRSARKTLSQQVRDTRGALHQMRGSAVSQIRTQQRSTAGQLTAQARAALQNARRESQGAVGGVGGAARSALPGYWRATQGLEQTLRRAGTQGGPAIDKAARSAPEGILRGLARTTESLQERLAGNRDRLDTSLARQAGTLADGRETQLAQAREAFATLTRDTTLQLDTSVSGMGEACSSLADSVTQAAASWAEPLATHFAGFIAEKQGEAQAALTSLLEGGGPPAGGGGGAPAAPAAAPGGAAAPGADSCSGCSTQAA